ncbi:MAG: HAMP domain-containing histidine kinase [Candidatus Woesearchaeota archaeon]|nr:MAG: HAMP domain-containing histidine kinase [Candidatus Woesearchaeota archaeon]
MIATSLELFHSISSFLSTPGGVLFVNFFEATVLIILLFLTFSEYQRSRYRQLRYFLTGFFFLFFIKTANVLLLILQIFTRNPLAAYISPYFVAVATLLCELFAISLIGTGFLYPLRSKLPHYLKNKFLIELVAILLFFAITLFAFTTTNFRGFALTLGVALETILLLLFIIVLQLYHNRFRYYQGMLFAFLLWFVGPFVLLLDLVLFQGLNIRLVVLARPFPVLGIIFLTRVIFLKLVDKAYLRRELQSAEKRYLEMREVSMMKDHFISLVSHELKTPITSIRLYADLIMQSTKGKTKEFSGIIKSEIKRLGEMVDDLLNFSKLKERKIKLEFARVDLNQIVTEALILSRKANVLVENKIPKHAYIYADPKRLKQIFLNLFTNALKFAKTKVVISYEYTKTKEILSVSNDTTEKERIPENEYEKIFLPFYQVENHMVRTKSGSGLGLAIVKELVDLHDGEIFVISSAKETTFTVSLPRKTMPAHK